MVVKRFLCMALACTMLMVCCAGVQAEPVTDETTVEDNWLVELIPVELSDCGEADTGLDGLGMMDDPNGIGKMDNPNGIGKWDAPNGLGMWDAPNGLGMWDAPN